jgi:hypothetical protein
MQGLNRKELADNLILDFKDLSVKEIDPLLA